MSITSVKPSFLSAVSISGGLTTPKPPATQTAKSLPFPVVLKPLTLTLPEPITRAIDWQKAAEQWKKGQGLS